MHVSQKLSNADRRQQFASDPNIFPEFAKPLKKAGAANEPKKSLEYRDAPSGIVSSLKLRIICSES